MAKKPSVEQKAGAERVAPRGSGKLQQPRDRRSSETRPRQSHGSAEADESPAVDLHSLSRARARLERERRAAIDRLRQLDGLGDGDDGSPLAGLDTGRDEGDQAQAAERADLQFMTRERLTERVARIVAALKRIQQGDYGRCTVCGRRIAAPRLAALPEAEMCVSCQEQEEARKVGGAA